MPFYRNRFPPSSPNALCASALALRAPYDAQSVVNAQRYLPYTSRNKIRPLNGSISERRRLVSDLDRRSHLVALNSGSIVALLALSQALVANGHFRDVKIYLLSSIAIFLGGICCGVVGFRSRARAMGAMIAGSGEIPTKVLFRSMKRAQTASALSFLLFVAGAICMGVGMAAKL